MNWPILTHYDQNHLARIALPLGGIGTGTISLGGRGDLRDFEVYSHPDKGFTPANAFFALFAKPEDGQAVARCLEGAIEPWLYEGAFGCTLPNHGLPRFRHCSFGAAYPLGQVFLSDEDVPLDVRLEAFNPLIPGDADASGLPVIVLRYVLTNKTDRPVAASVCGSLPNFIGNDGSSSTRAKANTIEFRKPALAGLFYQPGELDVCAEQHGTLALAALTPRENACCITSRLAWDDIGWSTGLLDFWDDFSADGKLDPRPDARKSDTPIGSLAVSVTVLPAGQAAVTFLIAWRFPNRQSWTPAQVEAAPGSAPDGSPSGDCDCGANPNLLLNYYATRFADAWAVMEYVSQHLPELEQKTLRFVNAFCESDLPHAVREAALFNLSTLRTQTAFRVEGGQLFGWEGCSDKAGCCHGSCTHVWNYEQATAFLFGALSKSLREVEFASSTGPDGLQCFRVGLPLARARQWPMAAADGQMGTLMKLYRDWQLSGDGDLLRRLWPQAKKALEFCWIPGGWDSDQDGVMEGCQHNTMDVEYYGPNPQMQAWYLGALRAMEEMAWHLGEYDFAERVNFLFQEGSAWMDLHLFNGEYYEHEICPPQNETTIATGLRIGMGAANLVEPAYQLGSGCLVDQLVGQYMAHICGLGYLLEPDNVSKALRSVMKYNYRASFRSHFNNMRSFVLGDEAAMLMASYPRGNRPRQPFPYATEVMTGFEYTAAVGMIYEGQERAGLKVIQSIRSRYDGRKRNPFDEAECGHHYARAMASWAAVLALTGFQYSAVEKAMAFAAQPGKFFWSTGYAWGTCAITEKDAGWDVVLSVLSGVLALKEFELRGGGQIALDQPLTLQEGETVSWVL